MIIEAFTATMLGASEEILTVSYTFVFLLFNCIVSKKKAIGISLSKC